MVQPRVSAWTGTGFGGVLEEDVDGVRVGGGLDGTTADSRAPASSAHPPTANAATTSAASTKRSLPRRGSSATGTRMGGGEMRELPPDGSQRSRTTPST